MKKNSLIVIVGIVGLICGVLIGKSELFPSDSLQSNQDKINNNANISNSEENVQYDETDLEKLLAVNPDNVDSVRKNLNFLIFGTPTLPEQLPDTVYEIEDDSYSGLANLDKIEQFNITQKYGIESVGYIFHPKNPIQRLMIYHQGHRGDFISGYETIKSFLDKGFTVYAFCMPLLGKNNQPKIYVKKLGEIIFSEHDRLKYLENPMQYFIAPVISMINYSEPKNFSNITMVGISGGGWTTTLTAAVDSRINFSFPVAGTYPMFIRFQKPSKNYGDFEQTYERLYSEVNYLDMYIMGAAGKERLQTQILNKYDECCFDGDDYKVYADFISTKVENFKNGNFQVFSDTSHSEHKISQIALSRIFDEINSSPNKN